MRRFPSLELALRLYPRSWRNRYGREVTDLAAELTDERGSTEQRVALGLVMGAPRVWRHRGLTGVSRRVLTTVAVLVGAGTFGGVLLSEAAPAASSATTVPFTIVSGAMAPALAANETVQVKPFTSDARLVRGEIVVFRPPPAEECGVSSSAYLVKRIVALPGQTISLVHGTVEVDGKKLREPWLPSSALQSTPPGPAGSPYDLHRPYRVPANSFFVLGDNRVDSCDSRYWGPVPRRFLYGAVVGHSLP
jgi:signal peptidase I